jgi:hypothetical protein
VVNWDIPVDTASLALQLGGAAAAKRISISGANLMLAMTTLIG